MIFKETFGLRDITNQFHITNQIFNLFFELSKNVFLTVTELNIWNELKASLHMSDFF